MEFILADQDRMELGILSAAASLDIDLSRDAENAEGTNDCLLYTSPSPRD